MKIGILGGTGKAGRALVAEAVARGHQTTAIVRDTGRAAEILGADVPTLQRDAFALTSQDLSVFNVVVNAFGTAPPDRASARRTGQASDRGRPVSRLPAAGSHPRCRQPDSRTRPPPFRRGPPRHT